MTSFTEKLTSRWESPNASQEEKKQGFGTFFGVFVPSILMVFGVIIFLRLGWIVGQAGIMAAFVIITFSTLIAFLTTLSMASISTNIEVGKGGVYYLLSRSLGIEVGSAIGLPLYFKQCLSIAFCVIGFAESLHDLIPILSITAIGIGTLILLTILAYFSLSGALKVQLFIFITIIASLISLFMGGSEMLPSETPFPTPLQVESLGFWALFAIFFPAMTGIESSVSLSGDLRNPGKSLPLGTISALLVAYVVYISISIFLVQNASLELLVSDPFIIQAIAKVPSLIVLGIWGATISSALGGLLGAPRTLQALAEDGVVPKIFGKGFGKMQEPRLATLTTCLIALVGIYFGSVNLIAPLLTMICLICYAILNLSAGLETLMANPSWRPRFRVPWSISILGAGLCFVAMVMIDAGYAILASVCVFLIYLVVKRRQHQNSWEDIRDGLFIYFSRLAIYRLAASEFISKSWRPHFLVFTKDTDDGSLLQFSQAISQDKGFITMASFATTPFKSEAEKIDLQKSIMNKLNEQNIHAIVKVCFAEKPYLMMNQLIETYGLGPLRPNTIICGVHKNENIEELSHVIAKAHQELCNIVILNGQKETMEPINISGNIHVWWDAANRANGEFMLVLAYMMNRNYYLKKSKICLHVIVSCELERKKALDEFTELARTKRLPLKIEILVSANPQEDYLKYITSFSSEASFVFLSLDPPSKEKAPHDYATYLKSMVSFSQKHPSMVLVQGSISTPTQNILI